MRNKTPFEKHLDQLVESDSGGKFEVERQEVHYNISPGIIKRMCDFNNEESVALKRLGYGYKLIYQYPNSDGYDSSDIKSLYEYYYEIYYLPETKESYKKSIQDKLEEIKASLNKSSDEPLSAITNLLLSGGNL